MKRRSNIQENIGAVTMVRKPADKLNEPDFRTPIPNIIHTGRSSAVPNHWNNSPFMSGGRYGAGALNFGANPKIGKKRVLSYKEFMKVKKKLKKNRSKK
jgi:hypothetical protein